jgi:hypothetical protein
MATRDPFLFGIGPVRYHAAHDRERTTARTFSSLGRRSEASIEVIHLAHSVASDVIDAKSDFFEGFVTLSLIHSPGNNSIFYFGAKK